MAVFRDFIKYICEERKNILAARPFFRERQAIFTSKVSNALRDRSEVNLSKFHFNFQFIKFTMKARNWGKDSQIRNLYNQIDSLRTEIIEMNMPLAISRTRIFYSKTPPSQLSYMDFVQIGAEGLMSAVDKFCLPYSKVFRSVIIGRIVGNYIESYSMDRTVILLTSSQQPKMLKYFIPGDTILGIDDQGRTIETEVVALHDHGTLEGLEVTFDDGYKIVCSKNHKFLTNRGMIPICDIIEQKLEVICEPTVQKQWLNSPLKDRYNKVSSKQNKTSYEDHFSEVVDSILSDALLTQGELYNEF